MTRSFILQKYDTHICQPINIFLDEVIYLLYITIKKFYEMTVNIYLQSFFWQKSYFYSVIKPKVKVLINLTIRRSY